MSLGRRHRTGAVDRIVAAATGSALLTGCAAGGGIFRDRVPTARSAEELGAINMSVVSVTRWQDVANDLEPQLPVDRQQILNEGVPTTATAAERIADAMQARLALSVAGSTLNNVDTQGSKSNASQSSSTAADGVTTTTSSAGTSSAAEQNDSTTKKTPAVPALPDVTTTTAPGLPGTRLTPGGVDAVTRATNAAAVIQSIVEINRSIRDAVRRTGYEPYLVRLQFGVQPRRREQPFDVTMRVAFLPSHDSVYDLLAADAALVSREGHTGRLGPMLSTSHSFGATGAPGDAVETPTTYPEARTALELIRSEQARVSGMIEDAFGYRIRVVPQTGSARILNVSKACFFPMIARFLTEKEDGQLTGAPTEGQATRAYAMLSGSARFATGFYEQLAQSTADRCGDPGYDALWKTISNRMRVGVPRVVTLVQTDNIEGTREYFAAEQLRQAALSLSALAGPIAGAAGFSRTLDRINDYEATRLNSIYSISQLAANTIQVRLGAARFGKRFEMIPRTIQATLLLLVPREQAGDTLDLVARPSFNNAETGATLVLTAAETRREHYQVREGLVQTFCLADARLPAAAAATCRGHLTSIVASYVEPSDWEGFNTQLAKLNGGSADYEICARDGITDRLCVRELWTELQREASRLRVMPYASVQLPVVAARNLPPMQTAVAATKEGSTSIALTGIDPWLKPSLRAALAVDCLSGIHRGTDGASVMASDLSLVGDVGTFRFPAVKSFTPKQVCLWIDDPSFTPAALASVDGFSARNPEAYPLADAVGDQPAAGAAFTLASDDQRIAVNADGTGVLRLAISDFDTKQIDSVLMSVTGSIVGVSGDATQSGFRAVARGNGSFELRLASVDTDRPIEVTAQGRKGKANVGKPVSVRLSQRLVRQPGTRP